MGKILNKLCFQFNYLHSANLLPSYPALPQLVITNYSANLLPSYPGCSTSGCDLASLWKITRSCTLNYHLYSS